LPETSKEKVFDLVLGIMYFVVGGIEFFALVVATMVSYLKYRRMTWLILDRKAWRWVVC
jgi:hypothetical protein